MSLSGRSGQRNIFALFVLSWLLISCASATSLPTVHPSITTTPSEMTQTPSPAVEADPTQPPQPALTATMPSLVGSVTARLDPGDVFIPLEGPVSADDYRWWRIQVESSGIEGWIVDIQDWYVPLEYSWPPEN